MLFIPLPFVVALLLLVLFVAMAKRQGEAPANVPFLALILASVVQSTFAGLRWGYGFQAVGYLAPIGAAVIPPLAYAGVAKLVRGGDHRLLPRLVLHALPAVGILVLMAAWRDAIDIALILIYLGYAAAILLLMRPGADALHLAPFDGAVAAYHAILFAAAALVLSAAVDSFIFLDFAWAHGAHALMVISIANLAALTFLAIAAAAASRSPAPDAVAATSPAMDDAADTETIAAVHRLMQEKALYRDPNLNLDRLARRAGIPMRQISGVINRATAKNVSQYVNEYRIAEACRLLAETEKTVTEIMFAVGFQTKSNFNREFRRVTDMTPRHWREKHPKRD